METADPYTLQDGRLRFLYHAGQERAMKSPRRFVLVLSGTQGGKTLLGPWWLLREITRRGAGDYLVATPTFQLLELKALPEFQRLFTERLQLGEYRGSPSRVFTLSQRGEEILFGSHQKIPTRVLFGHAQEPEGLESATIKAAWLDEAGQKRFKRGSWEAIQRRLSIHQGRVLITTTPYALGWLKTELHDPALSGSGDVDLIQFESTMNPAFPREEFERMRGVLPAWKFNMMYRGRFERPAGLIYDCFRRDVHCTPRFAVPPGWPRHLGLDFGGVNTAGVFLAREPGTGRHVLYRTYHAGSRTASEHAEALTKDEPMQPRATGGAKSEGQWRAEFRAAGLAVRTPPVSGVEVGIDRVYALLRNHPLLGAHDPARPYLEVMDDLLDLIDDLETYSRELDDNDEPTEKIEDKETWHRLDALRYVASEIAQPATMPGAGQLVNF